MRVLIRTIVDDILERPRIGAAPDPARLGTEVIRLARLAESIHRYEHARREQERTKGSAHVPQQGAHPGGGKRSLSPTCRRASPSVRPR